MFRQNTNLLGIFDPEIRESLPVLNSGLHPQQCDNDGLRSRAARVLHHAENDFDDIPSDFDPLNECADHVSAAMPVGLGELRAYGHRELTKTARRKSQVFQSIDIACVILYLCVELSDAALGSSHPRCELIFFNQTFCETVDQPLQRVSQLEPRRYRARRAARLR